MPHSLHEALASKGRFGDTMVAHINPREAQMLKAAGGAGTVNPETGLPEFFSLGDIGGLLSGGASILGGILGAKSQSDQVDAANQANAQNAELTREQIELARRALEAQLADRIDPYGNRVTYDEENGLFQTILAPGQQSIVDAEQAELLQQLTTDAARNRRGAGRAEQLAVPSTAQMMTEIGKFSNPDQYTEEGIRGLLQTQALTGIDQAFRDTTDAAARTVARTGPDAFGRTFDKIAQARGDANAKAMADAAVQALGLAPQLNQQGDNRISSRLATLSPLASGDTIRGLNSNTGSLASALSGQQANVGNAALGAASQIGSASFNPNAVNNPGVDIAGIGAGIGGLLQNLQNLGVSNPFGSQDSRKASGNTTTGPKSGGYYAANGYM